MLNGDFFIYSVFADQFIQYCEEIAATASWGGHLEVNSLFRIYITQIYCLTSVRCVAFSFSFLLLFFSKLFLCDFWFGVKDLAQCP